MFLLLEIITIYHNVVLLVHMDVDMLSLQFEKLTENLK